MAEIRSVWSDQNGLFELDDGKKWKGMAPVVSDWRVLTSAKMADKFLWHISIGWDNVVDVGSVGPNGVEEFIAIGDVHNLVNLKHTKEETNSRQWFGLDPNWKRHLRIVEVVFDGHSVSVVKAWC